MRVACPLLLALVALNAASEPPKESEDILKGFDDPQTLSQMLQWSLQHQDLDQLHERAEAIRQSAKPAAGTLSADGNENELPTDSTALPLQFSGGGASSSAAALTAERLAELSEASANLMPDQASKRLHES